MPGCDDLWRGAVASVLEDIVIRSVILSSIVAVAFLVLNPRVRAAVLYDSSGFEPVGSPAQFKPGPLEGQDATFGPWVTDNNVSSAMIQTSTVQAGTQAVRIDRAASATGDQRWSVFKPSAAAAARYLSIAWDQNVTKTTSAADANGPLFGVEAYDDTGAATVPLIGSAFVDSTTGSVYYQAHTTGNLAAAKASATLGQWNHFVLQADFNTSTYELFLNGSQIASDGFVDPGIVGFSDAPLATVAYPDGLPANAAASGTAYFDNYVISTATAVPEPEACSTLAAIVFAFTRHRRRSSH
jgi:hypothetical protein